MSKTAARASAAERAAAVRRAQESAERRRNVLVVACVLAVVGVLLGAGLWVQRARDTTGEPATPPQGATSSYGVVVGDDSAAKTITIYEDFQCPVCAALEGATAEKLREAVEAGKVKVEYRMVSFLDDASKNAYSSRAANAAAAVLDTAGIDAFWTFHDELFADQPDEGTAGPSNDELVDAAVAAGAPRAAVAAAVDDGTFDQWVANATDAMSRDGVTGTPTVLIDGKVAGSTPAEAAQAILDAVG
jgi:protein-disulfide isomerase